MSVCGLMITCNEDWIIRESLKQLTKICDKIIVLDGSSDLTRKFLLMCPQVELYCEEYFPEVKTYRDRRQFVLDKGRQKGYEYFITVDADEIISEQLLTSLKTEIPTLNMDESIITRWFHVTRECDSFISTSSQQCYQTIAFRNNGKSYDGRNHVHEDKAPGVYPDPKRKNTKVISNGGLLHLGMVNNDYNRLKQLYYLCLESMDKFHDVNYLNMAYYTKPRIKTYQLPIKFPEDFIKPEFVKSTSIIVNKIYAFIDTFGYEPLYPLNVWYEDIIYDYCSKKPDFDESKIVYNPRKMSGFQIKFMIHIRRIADMIMKMEVKRLFKGTLYRLGLL